jgi:hypothetical protein
MLFFSLMEIFMNYIKVIAMSALLLHIATQSSSSSSSSRSSTSSSSSSSVTSTASWSSSSFRSTGSSSFTPEENARSSRTIEHYARHPRSRPRCAGTTPMEPGGRKTTQSIQEPWPHAEEGPKK